MTDRFWTPHFAYDRRADGTILMRQTDPLPDHPQVMAAYLDHWAQTAPDRTWIARRGPDDDWITVTYAQALDAARRLGAGLLDLGVTADRPLLILSENSLEHALLGLAAAYVGVPFAPVAVPYSLVSQDHGKLRDIAATLNPGAVFADDAATFAAALDAISADGRAVITCRNARPGDVSYDDLMTCDPAPADAARAGVTADTVLKYLFTSGSTGTPKAVINTNGMVCASQAMVRDCYRYISDDPPVTLDWAPWNHTAAGNKVFYMILTNGGTYYIDDGRPAPGKIDATLRNLSEISCTWYFNVPVGYDQLVAALEQDDALAQRFFAKLGMLFYAGAGMAQQTWDRLSAVGLRITGQRVLLATGLGATETAPFTLACTDIQDQSGNVGVPARGVTLKLVPVGDKLEARIKGPNVTPGYLGDPVRTAEAFDDEGFYPLGDALRPADPDDLSKGFYFDGRLAENFKLTTGTWVAVGAVRARLVDAMGGLIRDAVIVGEDQAELGALLWLTPGADMDAVRTALAQAARSATGSASRVKRAIPLDRDPSLDAGEITEKGSLNQRQLRANKAELIATLYAGGEGAMIV
ncbi:feruloyl-CoA synthase [Loktanella sp. 3ANDIMAR09]|uniref:feruloyl-CoA synthase n=1 Tax=Loktanella sp. 3ANDIMAR09 TaxID=1225657 RepID=UPI0006F305F8|nr:feruloyl-CoA synthase [Loktanella sp. 3ANDIMAR09]KQI67497.1 feruloyl-CoA synthase [Loktanella sp. 3ANDIMAR09]